MSTLNSCDMNIERSSTRIKAPPGGQSSIFFGDCAPEVHNTSRSHSRPTYSSDFYGDDNNSNYTPQQTSNRRPHQQRRGNDIFGTDQPSASAESSSRRVTGSHQPPKQTLDVFNNSSNGQSPAPTPNNSRRPEQLDIFGRDAAPVQNPGRRRIQQPNSNIFEDQQDNVMDYCSQTASAQQHQQQYDNFDSRNQVAAGTRNKQRNGASSGIFDNNSSNFNPAGSVYSEAPSHRRPPASSASLRSDTDIFGNRQNEYREATDYQTSNSCYNHGGVQHQQGSVGGRRGDTTQSLGSAIHGGRGGYADNYQSQSRPNTGNSSSSMSMLMGDQQHEVSRQTTGRKASNAGQSSLVLN